MWMNTFTALALLLMFLNSHRVYLMKTNARESKKNDKIPDYNFSSQVSSVWQKVAAHDRWRGSDWRNRDKLPQFLANVTNCAPDCWPASLIFSSSSLTLNVDLKSIMSLITEGKNEWKREGRSQWLSSSYSSLLHGFDSCSCLAFGRYQKDIYPILGVSSGRA